MLLREGRDVEVVPGLVAAQGKPRLDPQDLRRGRDDEPLAAHLDLGGLQRPAAKQLTHAGLDASELAEDDLPRLGLGRRPVPERLQVLEDRVEALREVPDDMVVIERLPMVGVERRRGSPDQHGAGDQFLQLYGLLQDVFQRRLHIT